MDGFDQNEDAGAYDEGGVVLFGLLAAWRHTDALDGRQRLPRSRDHDERCPTTRDCPGRQDWVSGQTRAWGPPYDTEAGTAGASISSNASGRPPHCRHRSRAVASANVVEGSISAASKLTSGAADQPQAGHSNDSRRCRQRPRGSAEGSSFMRRKLPVFNPGLLTSCAISWSDGLAGCWAPAQARAPVAAGRSYAFDEAYSYPCWSRLLRRLAV